MAETARQLEAMRADLKLREDSLRESQTGHEQEKSQLAAEVARTRAQREQADRAAVANLAAQADEHRQQLARTDAEAKARADALQARHDTLQRERDALAADLAGHKKQADSVTAERDRLAREHDQLSVNVRKLNEEHHNQVEALNEEIRKHAGAATATGAQAARERQLAQADAAQKIEALTKDRAEAQRHRDSLAADLAKAREELQKHAAQATAATGDVAAMREELEKLKAERATWEKQLAETREAHRHDAAAMRTAQESLAGVQQKSQGEIARIETAHHNAASALAEERKRIETFRSQITELKREKKMELNAVTENFQALMREREAGVTRAQQEMARMREETARAAGERDEVVKKAEAQMAGAREAVAAEVAELKRQLEETNQRLAQVTAERDTLQAHREEIMRLPAIRPMTVTPPQVGGQP